MNMTEKNEIVVSTGNSQVITKLIDTISVGIGKIYEPTHIRRMAKAKASEIKVISDAMQENGIIPMSYDKGDIQCDTKDFDELVKRTQCRVAYQELQKQQNIEAVISNAYDKLGNEQPVSDKPVDVDWTNTFFDSVANVSSETMQELWGKLLAGEVKEPGSFSKRTMETLKNLSLEEANLFEQLSPYILSCKENDGTRSDSFIICSQQHFFKKYTVPYDAIFLLSQAGLISADPNISLSIDAFPNGESYIYADSGKLKFESLSGKVERAECFAHLLTEPGKELLPIMRKNAERCEMQGFLKACVDVFKDTTRLSNDTLRITIEQ